MIDKWFNPYHKHNIYVYTLIQRWWFLELTSNNHMSSDFPVSSWEKLRPTWSNWMSSDCLISSFWESIVWKIDTHYFWNWSHCIIYIKNKLFLYVLLIYIPFNYIRLNFWNTNCTLKIKEIKYLLSSNNLHFSTLLISYIHVAELWVIFFFRIIAVCGHGLNTRTEAQLLK